MNPQVPQQSSLVSPANLHEAVETIKYLISQNELLRRGNQTPVSVTLTVEAPREARLDPDRKRESVLEWLESEGVSTSGIRRQFKALDKAADQQQPNEAELAANVLLDTRAAYPLTKDVQPLSKTTLWEGRTVTLTPGQRTLLARKPGEGDARWGHGWMPTYEVEVLEVETYGDPHVNMVRAVVLHSREPAKGHTKVLRTVRIDRVGEFLSAAERVDASFDASRGASGGSSNRKTQLTPELSASLKSLLGL